MPLIKSHSNYVLKKKHQLVNDGTVFERDITTIGAVNQFAAGQKPIYKSGNFIITINDESGNVNQYNTKKWEQGADGDVWTLDTVNKMVSDDETQDDTMIVLKNDYYDFREFAYYGSLTELFRSSITDILTRFPGEMYSIEGELYYTTGYTSDFERIEDRVRLGRYKKNDGTYDYYKRYYSNPYGVNVHTTKLPEDVNPLRFFANGGYKNYAIIDNDGNEHEINEWRIDEYYSVYDPITKKYTPYTASTNFDHEGTPNKIVKGEPTDEYHPCKGEKVASMDINHYEEDPSKWYNLDVFAYLGDDDVIFYLTDDTSGYHIRPMKKFLIQFYNECNDFQRIILNPDTSPKYKAIFSVIKMNDFGYYREFETFIFPTSEGGYNPSADGEYSRRLAEIGEFYDEYLTDNLYRVMTHEAIKNFDWTYSKEYEEGEEAEYVEGGQKIQKALRIFAREFDEQKKYIDNIKNTGRLSYDQRDNIPDYFLTDLCEDDGWDVKSIIPYDLEGDYWTSTSDILKNTNPHKYSQSSSPVVYPYSSSNATDGTQNGYFLECNKTTPEGFNACLKKWYPGGGNCEDGPNLAVAPATGGEAYKKFTKCDGSTSMENIIKSYFDNSSKYTYMDVNNEFLRRLRLNSRQIWLHKGTLEGIEMILGMFGLKSKRWLCKNESCRYDDYHKDECGSKACGTNAVPDYEIIEYTQFTEPIVDTWYDTHQMFKIDWINSTKTITYDNRTTSNYSLPDNMGGLYSPYQGLPVAYIDVDERTRKLYPKFNKDEQYDGNPYFQMDGGWLAKTISNKQNFQFDVDDNIVHHPVITCKIENGFVFDNIKLYKETIRSIRRVENISELLAIPQKDLYDGIICYVGRILSEYAVIDGEAFEVEYEDDKKFVRFIKSDGHIRVGGLYFNETIVVYNKSGETSLYALDDKFDGYEVKAFIKSDGSFVCKSGESDQYSYTNFQLINTADNDRYSNYFKLDDTVFSDTITYQEDGNGWKRVQYKSQDYLKINTIYNYYKGNNGHNGKMKYDSGHEYFTYFQRLFKYAEDNSLFDTRCYKEGFDDLYNLLNPGDKPIGFSNLINPVEEITDYDKFLSADTKVHYFGNYKTRKSDNTIKDIKIYGDGVDTNEWKNFYNNGITPSSYSIGRGIRIDNEIQPHTSSDCYQPDCE